MDAWSFIGLLVLGLVVTFFAIFLGANLAQPRKVRDSKMMHFMTPAWLLIVEIALVIAIGFFLNKGFWAICGTWLIGGLILGYFLEFAVWKVTPKDKTKLWIKNAIEKSQREAEELCRQFSHQWGPWNDTDNICVLRVRKCTRCGMEESTDSGKHPWGEWKAGEKTCQQVRVCANCGLKEVRFDHAYMCVNSGQEWLEDTYRTGKGIFIESLKCSRCGEEREERRYDYVYTPDPW